MFDPYIVRGFDYYTGMVFEVFDTNPENRRSLFGGGRYDNLTELFGGDKIPAVGFGMGDVTIRDFLETHNLLPSYASTTELFIAVQDNDYRNEADTLAQFLRENKINVTIDLSSKKLGDQIKTADKQKIPYVTVIGEQEAKTHTYKIKNLSTGEEKTLQQKEIADYIQSKV